MGQETSKDSIKKEFDIKQEIGSGTYGTVKHCIRKKDGKEFAVKVIEKKRLNKTELESLHNEVQILFRLENKHCVDIVKSFENNKRVFVVMELLEGGMLYNKIANEGSLTESQASKIVYGIASGLNYLHSKGIVHRNLKPENLLFRDDVKEPDIVITDFALARFVNPSGFLSTLCGTPTYVAPEIIQNAKYDNKVDLWSLGIILYTVLGGYPPFYDENALLLYKLIKTGTYDFDEKYWADISDDAKDLIRRLLVVDPIKRLDAEQVLKHPWISKHDNVSDKPIGEDHAKRFKKKGYTGTLKKTDLLTLKKKMKEMKKLDK